MDRFVYKVKKIKGVFKFRSTKDAELQSLCEQMGSKGWELVSVNYDWFLVSYTLFFKRKLMD